MISERNIPLATLVVFLVLLPLLFVLSCAHAGSTTQRDAPTTRFYELERQLHGKRLDLWQHDAVLRRARPLSGHGDNEWRTTMKMGWIIIIILIASTSLAWSWPADDYGSERFSAINQCFIDGSKHKGTDKGLEPSHLALIACMDRLGFEPCDDCQVFGEHGPKCVKDEIGFLHSWCWNKIKEEN